MDQQHHSKRKAQSPEKLQGKRAPGHKFKSYEHSDEGEHRTTEQFYWQGQEKLSKWTLGAAVIAVVLSFATAALLGIQTNIAQKAYVDNLRAWLKISNEHSVFTWTGNGPTITSDLKVTNKGHTPASLVRLTQHLILSNIVINFSPHNLAKITCKEEGGPGTVVFPDDSFTMEGDTISLPWTNVDRTKPIPLAYIICTAYKVAGDTQWHHGGYAFRVGTIGDNGQPRFLRANEPIRQLGFFRIIDGDVAD